MLYLFDTTIVIETFRQNAAIIQRINQLQADPQFIYYLWRDVLWGLTCQTQRSAISSSK